MNSARCFTLSPPRRANRFLRMLAALALAAGLPGPGSAPVAAQQPPAYPERGERAAPPPPAATEEFHRAADEVLAQISELLGLPLKRELKKSIRSREEIRAYLVRRIEEEKIEAKWEADQKTLEKFGLIPKGFELEAFLIELLTEQVAGLYDPRGGEFFIADWIPLDNQREVMAHELAHALHDQHFAVDAWLKAARPDDDALLARNAVLEGAAMAAMVDYILSPQKMRVRDLPPLESLLGAQMLGSMEDSPQLARAPTYIRDLLLFPYTAGISFAQEVLKAGDGWEDFNRVFTQPPATTQQILHPQKYLAGYTPRPVALPEVERAAGRDWKKLDENHLGEFGLRAVLKQFVGQTRAAELGALWAGDRYAIFSHARDAGRTLLVFRLRLEDEEAAARLFGVYSELLELKYTQRTGLFRRPNFFSFDTPEGGVFLRCFGDECLIAEGADRRVFDNLTRALRWPAAPAPSGRPAAKTVAALAP